MAGFQVFCGNSLDTLAEKCTGLLRKPLPDPFMREIIVVQSADMERWLSLQLSRRLGVCAHIDFQFPNEFIDTLFSHLPGVSYEPRHFSIEALTWKIMKALPGLVISQEEIFREIGSYLKDRHAGDLKLYQLSRKIAGLFDHYTIYRPDLISGWENGALPPMDHDIAWQKALWTTIIGEISRHGSCHRVQAKKAFEMSERGDMVPDIPLRIEVFGISVLPFFYLDILKSLSSDHDVSLFVLQPSPRGAHEGGGNSLLLSMGTAGRYCAEKIMACATEIHRDFVTFGGSSMLAQIKEDITQNRDIDSGKVTPSVIEKSDLSIQIHSCHSPLREVEVLLDYLKHIFAEHREIQPHEVLVMTSDIEKYAPSIRSVFSRKEPFACTIADVQRMASRPVFAVFFELLGLALNRYEASSVLRLLERDLIRQSFGITEGDCAIISKWVRETNIRWGLDDMHRERLKFQKYRENSWAAGIERMMLGYAMREEKNAHFHDILPYREIEGSNSVLLGKFLEFHRCLAALYLELAEEKTLKEWSEWLREKIAQFLKPDTSNAYDLRIVNKVVRELGEGENSLAETTGFRGKISCQPVYHYLFEALSTVSHGLGYMRGGITFSGFLHMRSIPYKIICLLGMNIDAFPRRETPLAFDLLTRDPRKGDRSLRESDRSLFLETLLSAGQALYMSYVGQDLKDNGVIPPSVLVSELTEYMRDNFRLPGETSGDSLLDHITFTHRLHPFSTDYFKSSTRLYSYSESHCEAARTLAAGAAAPCISPLLLPGPEDKNEITIADLQSFFKNPASFFLRKRLGVYLDYEEEDQPDRECFEVTSLHETKIADLSIAGSFGQGATQVSYDTLRREDLLPPLTLGACEYEVVRDRTVPFINKVNRLINNSRIHEPLDIRYTIVPFTIQGELKNIYDSGLIHYHYRRLTPRHLLSLWIEHLFLCLCGNSQVTKLSTCAGKTQKDYHPSLYYLKEVKEPEQALHTLVEIYIKGTVRPIPFFPNTSCGFARKYLKTHDEPSALKEAEKAWDSDESYGEKNDRAVGFFFQARDPFQEPLYTEFRELARHIYDPILMHLEEKK